MPLGGFRRIVLTLPELIYSFIGHSPALNVSRARFKLRSDVPAVCRILSALVNVSEFTALLAFCGCTSIRRLVYQSNNRFQQDLQIEPKGPVLDIIEVVHHPGMSLGKRVHFAA